MIDFEPAIAGADRLTVRQVAERAGVKPDTIRHHQVRKTMPEPDGHLGVTPYWFVWTVERWVATRPKPGRRPWKTMPWDPAFQLPRRPMVGDLD